MSDTGRPGFQLILVDINPPLVDALTAAFFLFDDVTVRLDCFQHLQDFDCLVSPANSFGLMDGGVDAAIREYFGEQLEKRVQEHIRTHYDGEQPVGTSFIVPTGHPDHPFLAHTPTMRAPKDVRGTDNPYLAMKAMLRAVWDYNQSADARPIRSVACTGLGTFVGKVTPASAAEQMKLAYENFLEPVPARMTWRWANQRDRAVDRAVHSGDEQEQQAEEKGVSRV